ncbi:MAG: ATP phosphoribosyltransferase [Bacillota bacterium]|nr:ATP phosphoribosyltransferase [Bacillota bacterium]
MDKLRVAIPKGRIGEDTAELFNKIGIGKSIDMKSRKLVFNDYENNIEFVLLKNADVITYVENGVADIGIVGKDMIIESKKDIYELHNLKFGYCNMCIAGKEDKEIYNSDSVLKVATKFTNSTKEYFENKGQDISIIKLNGSVELAPVLGLTDVIVDIVETGSTLKANGLKVLEKMYPINSMLICNKISYRFKYEKINRIIKDIIEIEGDKKDD